MLILVQITEGFRFAVVKLHLLTNMSSSFYQIRINTIRFHHVKYASFFSCVLQFQTHYTGTELFSYCFPCSMGCLFKAALALDRPKNGQSKMNTSQPVECAIFSSLFLPYKWGVWITWKIPEQRIWGTFVAGHVFSRCFISLSRQPCMRNTVRWGGIPDCRVYISCFD